MELFAHYTCQQSKKKSLDLKAREIARHSTLNLIEHELCLQTIKTICRMASIDFIRAVAENGYMEALYSKVELQDLDSAIDQVCQDLTKDIFSDSKGLS